jgi:hypothetical protein
MITSEKLEAPEVAKIDWVVGVVGYAIIAPTLALIWPYVSPHPDQGVAGGLIIGMLFLYWSVMFRLGQAFQKNWEDWEKPVNLRKYLVTGIWCVLWTIVLCMTAFRIWQGTADTMNVVGGLLSLAFLAGQAWRLVRFLRK